MLALGSARFGKERRSGSAASSHVPPPRGCSPARAIDMIERFGSDRLWWDAACDWGPSVPLAVPRTAVEMRKRGHDDDLINKVIYENPRQFLGQCDRFKL